MPSKTAPKTQLDKAAQRLAKKLGRARGTASGYEAVVNAGSVLAMGGAVQEALACLRRVWACPVSVHRLLVTGSEPKTNSFATWLYKKLGTAVDPSATAKALGIKRKELLAQVQAEETRDRANLYDYLDDAENYEMDRRAATKKALALLKSIRAAKKKGRAAAALENGRKLLEYEASIPYYQRQRSKIVADLAFEAGELEEAYEIIRLAALADEAESGSAYSALEVLMFFEWGGKALVKGKLEFPRVDSEVANELVAAVNGFFERLEQEAPDADWLALSKKLAGKKGLQSPASRAAIKKCEKRLGLSLPSSYAAFLTASNGLKKSKKNLALLSVEKLKWFREVDPEWIDAYSEAAISNLEDTLCIATADDGEVYLLNPKVQTKSGEWEAWTFDNWTPGETRYPTFLALIENLLEPS